MPDLQYFSLKNKTALVTGALGLLGKNHCEALAEAGANVIVSDLNENECMNFANDLSERFNSKCSGMFLDITDINSVQEMRAYISKQYAILDVLVNNAGINDAVENSQGISESSEFENYPLELWNRSLNVNLTGVFLTCQKLGGLMKESGRGSIINIASTYGIVAPDQSVYLRPDGSRGFIKSPSYPVTKAGVIMLTKYLSVYWASSGVRVNSLSPGGVMNGQEQYFVENYSRRTPLGRMSMPDDYKGALIFLASDASSYMTGANLVVDGGWTAW